MMNVETALNIVNETLNLELGHTRRGDELKGVCPDRDDPGVTTLYLGKAECKALAESFAVLVDSLVRREI